MTTAAAIDRVVYQLVVLEPNVKSYRAEATKDNARVGRKRHEQGPDAYAPKPVCQLPS